MDDKIDPSTKSEDVKSEEKPKKIVLRCYCCKKKLKMIHFTCKCEHHFCIIHHNPHTHKCQYDYKKVKKQEIYDNNPLIHNKLIKI